MEWRKPSDRPEILQDVLIYYVIKGSEYHYYGIGWYINKWYTYEGNKEIECIAWAPLP